jgi:hypothetical protein
VAISPASPTTNQTLTATPSGFSDADGDSLTYHYTWKNGTTVVGSDSPTLDLSHTGNGDKGDVITVSVTASDGTDSSSAASDHVTVANSAPTVTLDTGNAYTYSESATAERTFMFSASDADGDSLTITVDCGPGTYVSGSKTASSFKCVFANGPVATGSQVSVSANDGDGGSASASHAIAISNVAPTLTAASGQTSNEGDAHAFSLGSFDDPGNEAKWSVDVNWGDSSAHTTFDQTSTGALPAKTHAYADGPNDYTVTVTVTDDSGSDSKTFAVHVSNVAPTITSWSGPNVLSGPMVFGLTGTWNGSFSDPGVNDKPWIASFTWDGVADPNTQTLNAQGAFGAVARPTFTSAGCTKVGTAKVTDKDGDFDTKSTTVQVGTGAFLPPMTNQPVTDQLKNGQVLPVKIRIEDCNGNPITGLNPSIVMKQGDLTTEVSDNNVDPITVTSVSAADTTGVMRYSSTDGMYMYNLKVNVPTNALNQPYTIVITPNIAGYPSGMTLKHKIVATK